MPLTITVPPREAFNDADQEFVDVGDEVTLTLEHSLISLSKWESFHEKPFLSTEEKTTEEILDYVEFMCMTRNVSEEVFERLSEENVEEIRKYLNAKMTATWIKEAKAMPRSRQIITSELIYYWMIAFNIPFECEKWHLNRLFTLIQVCSSKAEKPEKMSRAEIVARNRELNEQRKARFGTKG